MDFDAWTPPCELRRPPGGVVRDQPVEHLAFLNESHALLLSADGLYLFHPESPWLLLASKGFVTSGAALWEGRVLYMYAPGADEIHGAYAPLWDSISLCASGREARGPPGAERHGIFFASPQLSPGTLWLVVAGASGVQVSVLFPAYSWVDFHRTALGFPGRPLQAGLSLPADPHGNPWVLTVVFDGGGVYTLSSNRLTDELGFAAVPMEPPFLAFVLDDLLWYCLACKQTPAYTREVPVSYIISLWDISAQPSGQPSGQPACFTAAQPAEPISGAVHPVTGALWLARGGSVFEIARTGVQRVAEQAEQADNGSCEPSAGPADLGDLLSCAGRVLQWSPVQGQGPCAEQLVVISGLLRSAELVPPRAGASCAVRVLAGDDPAGAIQALLALQGVRPYLVCRRVDVPRRALDVPGRALDLGLGMLGCSGFLFGCWAAWLAVPRI
jgi:hypothetical protein